VAVVVAEAVVAAVAAVVAAAAVVLIVVAAVAEASMAGRARGVVQARNASQSLHPMILIRSLTCMKATVVVGAVVAVRDRGVPCSMC
jgi:hypothetical protein